MTFIFSRSKEDHKGHLRQLSEVMRANRLKMQLKKYSFMVDSVNFLGFMVSKDGICVDPPKVSANVDWQVPTSLPIFGASTVQLLSIADELWVYYNSYS